MARSARRDERVPDPPLPEDVDPRLLDPEVRQALRSLTAPVAERVAKHLTMAGQLADTEPERALAHARAARRLGGRLALVREAAGITAYLAGEWAEALNELRAARRIGGENTLLHVMADCERALGRPERALDIARGPEIAALPADLRVEMALVEAGARRDLGQVDAAVLVLRGAGVQDAAGQPWSVRLWYAYADALLAAGRRDEAARWFAASRDADLDEETDAADRLAELESDAEWESGVDAEADVPADGIEVVELADSAESVPGTDEAAGADDAVIFDDGADADEAANAEDGDGTWDVGGEVADLGGATVEFSDTRSDERPEGSAESEDREER